MSTPALNSTPDISNFLSSWFSILHPGHLTTKAGKPEYSTLHSLMATTETVKRGGYNACLVAMAQAVIIVRGRASLLPDIPSSIRSVPYYITAIKITSGRLMNEPYTLKTQGIIAHRGRRGIPRALVDARLWTRPPRAAISGDRSIQ